jgi:chemotaxis protein MotB
MTGATGAAGYLAWDYRAKAETATSGGSDCMKARASLLSERGALEKTAADCNATLAKQTQDMKSTLDTTSKSAKTLEQQNQELMSNLNATKSELDQLRVLRAETEKRVAAIEDIQKQFARMINTGDLKVTSRRGSLVLSLPAEVLFPSGVAELSKDGEIKVIEVGLTLKKFPDRRFLVVGHSDNQPLKNSTFKDNWELSTARALNVTRTLVKAGMSPKNLVPAGVGEFDPIAKERAKNRRIEIALLPAIEELPPLPASVKQPDGKTDAKR